MDTLVLTAAVVGAVELVRQAFDQNWKAVVTIAVAGALGWFFGPEYGLSHLEGLTVGLSGSGLVTTVQKVSQKTK